MAMYFKVTYRFNWGNIAGWTESFYLFSSQAIDSPDLRLVIITAARSRAGCLTKNATLLDAIVSLEGSPGVTQTIICGLPGALGSSSAPLAQGADVVMLAIKVRLTGVGGTSRRFYLMRGLVDGDIQGGVFTGAASGFAPFNDWFAHIRIASRFRLKNRTNGFGVPLGTISGNGKVQLSTGLTGVAVGSNVNIVTQVAGLGRKYNVMGVVKSIETPYTEFSIRPWSAGNCSGGRINLTTYDYPDIANDLLGVGQYVRTRKTGRPFGSSRGKSVPRQRNQAGR